MREKNSRPLTLPKICQILRLNGQLDAIFDEKRRKMDFILYHLVCRSIAWACHSFPCCCYCCHDDEPTPAVTYQDHSSKLTYQSHYLIDFIKRPFTMNYVRGLCWIGLKIPTDRRKY